MAGRTPRCPARSPGRLPRTPGARRRAGPAGPLLEAVDPDRAGLASGILNAARQFGGAVGVAIFGALLGADAHGKPGPTDAAGFISGMRAALVIAAAVLLASAAASAVSRRQAFWVR